jgi:ABC-2 type transport system ATP-binding protein
MVGYCTQYDTFPPGDTGLRFLTTALALHGKGRAESHELAWKALERVGMEEAAKRRIAGYSKGMRQRIKLAHALAHEPQVLVLDEPLNGLDPMARSEMIALMREMASAGRHVIVSSHILHEVDQASDQMIMIHGGSVLAEGEIPKVRGEITRHPIQVLIRCSDAHTLAASAFQLEHVVEAKILAEGEGLLVRTRDAEAFLTSLNRMVVANGIEIETVAPADDSVHAVYEYLIGDDGGGA